MPDATTLLNFRNLLENHDLCKGLFSAINADLTALGLLLREGTLVDATLIPAPPSTKKQEKQRDPGTHRTKKGNQWGFGMKAHTGVEKRAEIVAMERKIDWQIAGKRSVIKAMAKAKASVRAVVEHPFHIVKNLFRHRKVPYRRRAKNGHQLYTLFGLANVVIGSRTATTLKNLSQTC